MALCALRMGAPALMVRKSFLSGWTLFVFQVLRSPGNPIPLPVRSESGEYAKSFLGLPHRGPVSTSKPGCTHDMPHLGTQG